MPTCLLELERGTLEWNSVYLLSIKRKDVYTFENSIRVISLRIKQFILLREFRFIFRQAKHSRKYEGNHTS